MISTQMLSSRWVLSAITYSGPITATIGSILVGMKKNRPSRPPGGSRSRPGPAVAVAVAVISCLLELEAPGEHPQRERGHDDRKDDGPPPGRGRPADVERVIHLLVQVVGQVGGGGPRAALGHGLDLVEHVDQVDRAEQDAQLDVGPQVR